MTEADVLRTHVDLFYGALKSRDWDELAAVYSDDYMLVRPDGSVLNKQEVLEDLRGRGLVFHSIELEHENVRIYGTAAVLTGESTTVSSRDGKRSQAHFRFVAVYAKEGEQTADLLLINGKILTVDAQDSVAEAVAGLDSASPRLFGPIYALSYIRTSYES